MTAIQNVLTNFQMRCSSVSWFGRLMTVSVVMDDYKGTTITDTHIGHYLINGHTLICQTHVMCTLNIVSSSGCGFIDYCSSSVRLVWPLLKYLILSWTFHWQRTQISAPNAPRAHKKQITACCSSLVHMEMEVAMLTLVSCANNWSHSLNLSHSNYNAYTCTCN